MKVLFRDINEIMSQYRIFKHCSRSIFKEFHNVETKTFAPYNIFQRDMDISLGKNPGSELKKYYLCDLTKSD